MVELKRDTAGVVPPPQLAPLPLAGGPLLVWPLAVVRGAGFPLADLVALGDEEYLAAVDAALDAGAASVPPDVVRAAERRQQAGLREVAGRDRFREAICWQNHPVVEPMVDKLAQAAEDTPRNQWLRRRETIVARYWSRYCAKNDTIGFFGPVCWAEVRPGGPAVTVHPGLGLETHRRVLLESWAVETVAEALLRDPALRRRVPPRPHPAYYLAGPMLVRSDGPPEMLTELETAVLRLCDGHREPAEIARTLAAEPGTVESTLDSLAARGALRRDLEPPLSSHPERHLRAALDRLAPESLPALAALDRWEATRDRAAAAGTADAILAALDEMNATFVDITDGPAARRPGETYGGRRLVYLDSRRDLDIAFGPQVLAAVGAPLTALILSGRWLTEQIGDTYRRILTEAYHGLAEANPGRPIGYTELVYACAWAIFASENTPLSNIIDDFAARAAKMLGLDTDTHEIRLTGAVLAALVERTFGPATAGWEVARQHSADLQIAAADVDAVRRGEFIVVLGELHLAWNTVECTALVEGSGRIDELRPLVHLGLPGPRLSLVPVKKYPRISTRTMSGLNEEDWHLAVTDDPGGVPERRIALASLIVELHEERLRVRTMDGALSFDPIDVMGFQMAEDVTDAYKRVARVHPHSPRVVVDRLVVLRETWNVRLGDIPLPDSRGEADCFLQARRWARGLGLPRFAFVSLPGESKPFYVDFASSALITSLATGLRQALAKAGPDATVAISEMLPAPGQEWLPDAAGNRYTSELRLQLVDPVG